MYEELRWGRGRLADFRRTEQKSGSRGQGSGARGGPDDTAGHGPARAHACFMLSEAHA